MNSVKTKKTLREQPSFLLFWMRIIPNLHQNLIAAPTGQNDSGNEIYMRPHSPSVRARFPVLHLDGQSGASYRRLPHHWQLFLTKSRWTSMGFRLPFPLHCCYSFLHTTLDNLVTKKANKQKNDKSTLLRWSLLPHSVIARDNSNTRMTLQCLVMCSLVSYFELNSKAMLTSTTKFDESNNKWFALSIQSACNYSNHRLLESRRSDWAFIKQ